MDDTEASARGHDDIERLRHDLHFCSGVLETRRGAVARSGAHVGVDEHVALHVGVLRDKTTRHGDRASFVGGIVGEQVELVVRLQALVQYALRQLFVSHVVLDVRLRPRRAPDPNLIHVGFQWLVQLHAAVGEAIDPAERVLKRRRFGVNRPTPVRSAHQVVRPGRGTGHKDGSGLLELPVPVDVADAAAMHCGNVHPRLYRERRIRSHHV